jgi:hypothetical protein
VDDLQRYFHNYGWSVDFDEDRSIKTGWQGKEKSFSLYVTINPTIISFEVDSFFCLEPEWMLVPEILAYLLDLNHQSHFVKLSLAESGRIALSASALVDGFRFENLARTLEIVGYYCDLLYESIMLKLEQLGIGRVSLADYITH